MALECYNEEERSFLLNGLEFGFDLGFKADHIDVQSTSHLSAIKHPDILQEKISKEVVAGRIAGPFSSKPFQVFRTSPLGLVPKQDPGTFRLIFDLSSPDGRSFNDGIPKEYSTVSYMSVADAIEAIKTFQSPCYLAKTSSDIKSAFRILPVSPSLYSQMGMIVSGQWFYERCLPMGAASSCAIFTRFAKALVHIAQIKLRIPKIIFYLDDFLLLGDSKTECLKFLTSFKDLCSWLGVPLNEEKTSGPSQVMSFLGIELDTVSKEARLPNDKIIKALSMIGRFQGRKSVKVKELESLHGYLNYCAQIIPAGRAFLRRLSGVMKGHRSIQWVKISKELKEDLKVWELFLTSFNGRSFFINDGWAPPHPKSLQTDASGSVGYGAVYGTHFLYGSWPKSCESLGITIFELYPIVLGVYLFADEMANTKLVIYSDNLAVVHILNNLNSTDPRIMKIVRKLVLKCLAFNIFFQAFHVPGIKNVGPDTLSRGQVEKFLREFPKYRQGRVLVPSHLRPENFLL